jgi:shikimate kinase
VWIDVPLDELLARIPADGRRPLAADRVQMERLFMIRQAAYANAHVRIDARGAAPEDVVDRILEVLGQEPSLS